MIVHPRIDITPNRPTVAFREPRENIDLDIELTRILKTQDWSCGTYFHVQFVNHSGDKLYSSAIFVVTRDDESLQTSDANPYQPMSRTIRDYKAEIVGEWWFAEYQEEVEDTNIEAKMFYDKTGKVHQARLGTDVLFESPYKGKVQEWIRENRPS